MENVVIKWRTIRYNLNAENSSKRGPGRPHAIENGSLWGVRDHLVWLLETTWADVGGGLSTIKTPADVCAALQIWRERSHEYITQLLSRPSSSPATAKQLNERRRQLGELNASVREAWAFREKCRESLEVAQRALNPQLSEGERAVVEEQITKRAEKFSQAEAEYNTTRSQQ